MRDMSGMSPRVGVLRFGVEEKSNLRCSVGEVWSRFMALSGWARGENVLLLKSSSISIQCWDDTFGSPQCMHIHDTLECLRFLNVSGPILAQAAWYHTSQPSHWMLLLFQLTFFLQIPHGYLGPGLISMSPAWISNRYISVQVLTSFLSPKKMLYTVYPENTWVSDIEGVT